MYQFVIAIVVIVVIKKFFDLIFGKSNDEDKKVDGDDATNTSAVEGGDGNEASASTEGAGAASSSAAAAAARRQQEDDEATVAALAAAAAVTQKRVDNAPFATADDNVAAALALSGALSALFDDNGLDALSSYKAATAPEFQKAFKLNSQKQSKAFVDKLKAAVLQSFAPTSSAPVPPALLRSYAKDPARTLDAIIALAVYKYPLGSAAGADDEAAAAAAAASVSSSSSTTIGEKINHALQRSSASSSNASAASLDATGKLRLVTNPIVDLVAWLLAEVLPPVRATSELRALPVADALSAAGGSVTLKTSAFTHFAASSSAAACSTLTLLQPKRATLFAVLQTGAAASTAFLAYGAAAGDANCTAAAASLMAPPGTVFTVVHSVPRGILTVAGVETQHSVLLLRDKSSLIEPPTTTTATTSSAAAAAASFFLKRDDIVAALAALRPVFGAKFISSLFVDNGTVTSDFMSGPPKVGGDSDADVKQKSAEKLSSLLGAAGSADEQQQKPDLFLVAKAGYGKTASCAFALSSAIEALASAAGSDSSDQQSALLPVYVPLHRLTQQHLDQRGGLDALLLAQLGITCNNSNNKFAASIASRMLVLLDGLDESMVPNVLAWRSVVDRNPVVLQNCARIVVTCRAGWRGTLPPRELLKGRLRSSADGTMLELAVREIEPMGAAGVSAVCNNYAAHFKAVLDGQAQLAQSGGSGGAVPSTNAAAASATSPSSGKKKGGGGGGSGDSNKSSGVSYTLSPPLANCGLPFVGYIAARFVSKPSGSSLVPNGSDVLAKLPHPIHLVDHFIAQNSGNTRGILQFVGNLAQEMLRRNGHCTVADVRKVLVTMIGADKIGANASAAASIFLAQSFSEAVAAAPAGSPLANFTKLTRDQQHTMIVPAAVLGAREFFTIEDDFAGTPLIAAGSSSSSSSSAAASNLVVAPAPNTMAVPLTESSGVSFTHRLLMEHFVTEIAVSMQNLQVLEAPPPASGGNFIIAPILTSYVTRAIIEHPRVQAQMPQLRERALQRLMMVERDLESAAAVLREQIAAIEKAMRGGQIPADETGPLALANFHLTAVLMDMQRWAEARDALLHTFLLAQKKFGPISSQIGDVLFRLGTVFRNLQELEQAKTRFQQALKVRIQVHGEDSPQVIEILWNLSRVHGQLGEREPQLGIAQRALDLCEKRFSKEDVNYAFSLDCLAEALGAAGDGGKMWTMLQQSLLIKTKVCGPDHQMVREGKNMMRNVLQHLHAQGAMSEAEMLGGFDNIEQHGGDGISFNNAADAEGSNNNMLTRGGASAPSSAVGSARMSSLSSSAGGNSLPTTETNATPPSTPSNSPPSTLTPAQVDAMKRRNVFEAELSRNLARFGENHLQVADTLFNLGVACTELEQHRDALDRLLRARSIFGRQLPATHEQIGWAMLYICTSLTALHKADEAKKALQEATSVLCHHADESNKASECTRDVAASIYNDLGVATLKLGDAAAAKALFLRALDADKQHHYGEKDDGWKSMEVPPESATTLMHLADACGMLGETAKKAELMEEVVSLKERMCGPHDAEVADALVFLSKAYEAMQPQSEANKKKADEAMRRAQVIFAKRSL